MATLCEIAPKDILLVLGIKMCSVVAAKKVKGKVWGRLMTGQMGEYINVDQFRSASRENVNINRHTFLVLLKICFIF